MSLITLIKIHILSNFQGHLSTNEEERSKKMRELILSTRNSFLRFRAGLKVNLRQYIKSDFDLFWGPDVLWRSDFDVINRSPNFIRLLLNSPLESHWIRGLKLTSKLRAVQFWVSWKKMTTKSERRTSVSSSTVWYTDYIGRNSPSYVTGRLSNYLLHRL